MAAASGVLPRFFRVGQVNSYRIRRSSRAERGVLSQPSLSERPTPKAEIPVRVSYESATPPKGERRNRYPVNGRVVEQESAGATRRKRWWGSLRPA